jgi:hypothetical protein
MEYRRRYQERQNKHFRELKDRLGYGMCRFLESANTVSQRRF